MKISKNIVNEPEAGYKKAEDDLLKRALTTTYTERFHTMARLMKLNIILKSAKIVQRRID